MATTVAALKSKFGSTEYYILAMKAGEIAKTFIPSTMPGWDTMSMEENEQRDIDYPRIKKWLVPYLAKDKDRFFGAFIMMVRNFDPKKDFEPISEVAKRGLHRLYETQASSMGFLTLTDSDLIPLDGQHRLKALEFAITGVDETKRPIDGTPVESLRDEEVTVILIPYEKTKARRIFTKVNKYAKPTTTGQNLVTDDDDIIAVLSRKIANDILGGASLVKSKGNTLNDSEAYFTTLATVAECNVEILDAHLGVNLSTRKARNRPVDAATADIYEEKLREIWRFLVEKIEYFADALADKSEHGNANRREIRKANLLGKPAPQFSLVAAFARLTGSDTRLPYGKAAKKLNDLDWRKGASDWDRLFMLGETILHKNKRLVAEIVHYRLGGKLTDDKKSVLLEKYQALFPENERATKAKELPPPL